VGLVGLAVAVGALTRTGASHPTQAGGPVTPPATPVATTPVPAPVDVPSSTAPPSPSRPAAPDDALALTDQQALAELSQEADESIVVPVPVLQGTWVPQVSSKCVGIPVDIGPDWFPDGTDDTPHISIQQLLAFHLSMHGRFGAVTVRPTQVGVRYDRATSGPCSGQQIWMSIVPRSYPDAAGANAWCAENSLPVKECAARYVAGPGQQSTLVLRQ
jgi:serine/threonine kinase PknH